jgi:cytochrome c
MRAVSALAGSALALALGAAPAATAAPPGDPANGEAIYSRCLACHALAYDRTGPRHCGLIGRRAGAVEGFPYTKAMKRSGIVWTAATLDRFLASPMGTVPGTAMGYAGIADAKERADLIAWLDKANDSMVCKSQKTGRAQAR